MADAKRHRVAVVSCILAVRVQQGTFAPLIRTQRCIVPASGFFEWPREGRQKLATFIRPEDQDVFAMAGLWADWTDPSTHQVKRGFAILTTQPSEFMRSIHNRMPIILPRSAIDEWLDPSPTTRAALDHLLVPYAGPMTSWRVTERVGNVRYKEADAVMRIDVAAPALHARERGADQPSGALRRPREAPQSPGHEHPTPSDFLCDFVVFLRASRAVASRGLREAAGEVVVA